MIYWMSKVFWVEFYLQLIIIQILLFIYAYNYQVYLDSTTNSLSISPNNAYNYNSNNTTFQPEYHNSTQYSTGNYYNITATNSTVPGHTVPNSYWTNLKSDNHAEGGEYNYRDYETTYGIIQDNYSINMFIVCVCHALFSIFKVNRLLIHRLICQYVTNCSIFR